MDTTKELIAHVNDVANAIKATADQCEWTVMSPKRLKGLDLETFVALCEWRGVEPKVWVNRFEVTFDIENMTMKMESAMVPELLQRKEASVLDLIKSILSDRKAKEQAA